MYRILLLFFALLLASNVESVAARPTAYARAKMKGRSYTHRPFYKKYKGRKAHKKRGLFNRKARSQSSYKVGRHSTR